MLDRIHRTLLHKAGDDAALVPSQLRTAALERVFGFEIMPAPFVIAHMEIARLLEEARAPLRDDQRAGVFLTNALTGWIPEMHPQSVLSEEFRREREDSEHIKQHGTILVILGNPPYNGYAGIAKMEEERDLTTAYRAAITGLSAPQGQGLNDLYIRFFRIAERRIAANTDGQGIVSFISNYSWLEGLSHTTMRHLYLRAFQKIFIDNLNGDKYRTGKTTPEGLPDPSAFSTSQNREGIQVGTAIATLVRHPGHPRTNPQIRDLWGTRKLAQLLSESRRELDLTYVTISPIPALGNAFAYRAQTVDFLSWPRIPDLFPISFPGIKTSRDFYVVDVSKERLIARMQRYFDTAVSDSSLAAEDPQIMSNSYCYNAIEIRTKLASKGFRQWQVLRYTYRPFDVRWIYWEPEEQLLRRPVPDYVKSFLNKSASMIVPQQNRRSYDPPCLASELVDLNLSDGGSNAFPSLVIRTLITDSRVVRENTSSSASVYLEGHGSDATELLLHSLAITHAPQYAIDNSSSLLRDWPRIPLPATADLLAHSATLGRRLAELLDAESSINLSAEWSFLAALKLPQNLPLEEALKLTAGWGSRGQGSTVMPGRGLSKVRDWTATERDRLTALAAAQGLTLEDALAILGASCLDIHLNGAAFWSAVPANVWTYTLGGYQVLKKWLSYRELPLLQRPLHPEEAAWFAQVVRRITAILLMGPALDASYQAILPTATGLPAAR